MRFQSYLIHIPFKKAEAGTRASVMDLYQNLSRAKIRLHKKRESILNLFRFGFDEANSGVSTNPLPTLHKVTPN